MEGEFPEVRRHGVLDVRIAPRSYAEQRFYLRGGEFATTVRKKRIMPFEGRPFYSSVAWPIGPGPMRLALQWGDGGIRNPFEWTPQSEAWVEPASWIAEEKRARLRDDPTEEPSPASPSNFCMQQTQETDAH